MREVVGPALAHGLMLTAGLGVLMLTGELRRRSLTDLVRRAGLAYLVGVAAVMLVGITVLSVGLPFDLVPFTITALLLTGAGLARLLLAGDRERSPAHPPVWRAPRAAWLRLDPRRRAEAAFGVAALGGYAVYALWATASAFEAPLFQWDGWSIWARKAVILAGSATLPEDFRSGLPTTVPHPEYPILVPLFEAMQFRAGAEIELRGVPGHLWLLLSAFVWAAADLAWRHMPQPVLTILVVCAGAAASGIASQLASGYADVPMALFLALGMLLLGEYVLHNRRRTLVLAVLLLGAAANVKNEGLMAAFLALAAAAVVLSRPSQRSRLPTLAAAGAGLLACVLPWHLHLFAWQVEGDLPIARGLDPAYLASRTERVWPTVVALAGHLADQAKWSYIPALALVAALVGLLTRSLRPLATYYLLAGALFFGALVWVYWISPNQLNVHLQTSADRTITGLVLISLAGLAHLVGQAPSPDPHVPGGTPPAGTTVDPGERHAAGPPIRTRS